MGAEYQSPQLLVACTSTVITTQLSNTDKLKQAVVLVVVVGLFNLVVMRPISTME